MLLGDGAKTHETLDFIELERVMGIEPTYAAWKAAVLPLNYTRNGEILSPSARLSTRR